MDTLGVDVAITSISTPGVHLGDDRRARNLARRCNEFAAELIAEHPARFGGFAILPLPDVEGALAELEHSLDVLGLDGVCLISNAGGRYLGDPAFSELFAELQERAAVVFVHPTASPDPAVHAMGLTDNLIDYPLDTTRTVAQLHYGGAFARTPDVSYISDWKAVIRSRPHPVSAPITPWASANMTSSARVSSRSFCMMCARCVSTVRTEMNSFLPIS
jgi:predicted TIM-barrel fold metal-dependent hydrolase